MGEPYVPKEIEARFLTLKEQAREALQLLPQVPQELEAIFRRLGVDRSTLAYDDATICAAAQEIRLALTLVGRAVDSTEDVVGRQTRDRFSNAIRRGLGTGFDRFVKQDPASHQGG